MEQRSSHLLRGGSLKYSLRNGTAQFTSTSWRKPEIMQAMIILYDVILKKTYYAVIV